MIAVTRLDGSAMVVNCDLIERLERTPDTLIVLSGGERVYVREQPDELIRRVVAFKRSIHAGPVIVHGGRASAVPEVGR